MTELTNILTTGAMRRAVPYTDTLEDTAWSVLEFDTISVDPPDMDISLIDNSITVTRSGLYKINYGINAIFDATERVGINLYINDLPYSGQPLSHGGEGSGDPIELYWASYVPLSAGNVVDVRGTNMDTGTLSIEMLRMVLGIEWKNDIIV